MKKNVPFNAHDAEQTQEREHVPLPGTKDIPTNSQAVRDLTQESEGKEAGRNQESKIGVDNRESNSEDSQEETNY